MKIKEKFVQLWNKFSRWLSVKKLAIGAFAAFLLSLFPILYLTVVNRASGDDYGYGKYTRPAWAATHSLIEVAKAIGQTIRQYYYGWQGTWFSIALFTLQPEVFHDKAYIIVTPLMLLLWIGSTFYLFREILIHHMKIDKWSYRLITILFLFISIQFIPGKKSSLYWFNGCAHYMIPFTMCQLVLVWLLKWGRTYDKRYFIGILLFMTLLGGSNYQAALLVFLFAVYYGMYHFFHEKDKRVFLLCIPLATELAGLLVSMLAPGNKARGGEAFGLSAGKLKEVVKYKQAAAHACLVVPGLMVLGIAAFICRHGIKTTTDYICYDYISSGQASDYKEQMDLQTRLLLDPQKEDIVIPGINDQQGPLMHMPVTEDVSAWTNYVTADFYEKNSVVSIPRPEWMEKYGQGE